MTRSHFLRHFNWPLFVSMAVLVAIGTVAIWSAGSARAESVFHSMWRANLATAALGLVAYFAIALTDYRKWLDIASPFAYAFAVVTLVAVLAVGTERFGGRRWLWFFQPSEVAKLCVIAFVASLYGGIRTQVEWLGRFRGFLVACALVGVPALLILAEPDLGTTLALLPAVALMLFAARVWRLGLVTIAVAGAVAAFALLGAVYEAERPGTSAERRDAIVRSLPLKDHQLRRVRVFLFPEQDPSGAGYNLRQAEIAIGSGGFCGKGFGHGDTNRLKYLPQAISMNDFIFCVYAEETGFVGSLVLVALFGTLVVSGAWTAFVATEPRGRLLALGISTLVFAHVFVNIAMSLGLVPITGLPLPFISSGRTFLLTIMTGLGIIQSVSLHRGETS